MSLIRTVTIAVQSGEQDASVANSAESNHTFVKSTDRSVTDKQFIFFFGFAIMVLMFFLVYCVVYGDIERLTVGHDRCGNVCGKINNFDLPANTKCKTADMTEKPFLDVVSDTCIARCYDGSIEIGRRCIPTGGAKPQSFLDTIARDLHTCSSEIVGLCFLALAFSFLILLILRYMAAAFVWTVLIGVVAACASVTGLFWYLTEVSDIFTPVAIVFSIITVIIVLVIIFLRKRIELVIQLLKEAGKSITAIPLLIIEPILTFVALGITASLWIYFTLWIESAGMAVSGYIDNNVIVFHKNGLMKFTRWYSHFIMLWLIQFIYGCQNMLIAGAVSMWYFTRNKAMLNKSICKSAKNMLKYHLGTISLGSLLVALIQMLRILMRCCRRVSRVALYLCCLCCIYSKVEECFFYLENLMKYLTRNAYIVTAIHGSNFVDSGTKAFKLLMENILRVFVINSVGDFVLVLSKILVVLASVLIGAVVIQGKPDVTFQWAPLVVVGIVAYLIAHCFMTVYEMAVDTIFICFCEDCNINDGLSRPYYMSHSLMEFVEKSRLVLNIKTEEGVVTVASPM